MCGWQPSMCDVEISFGCMYMPLIACEVAEFEELEESLRLR